MAATVSDLNLPTLPVGGYTEFEFQVWWQEVVTRIESAISAININGTAVDGSQEQVAVLAVEIAGLRSLMQRMGGEIQEQIAAMNARPAHDRKMAQAIENTELMAWLL